MQPVRRRAAALRARGGPPPGPGTEVFTVGTRLTRVTREMRGRDPSAALLAVVRRGAGLERRHPARRAAQGVPGPVGAARPGPRRGRRGRLRRLGARRRALLGEQMARLAPARAPGRLGQPAPRPAGLRPADRRACAPRCRTSTTSWTGTALAALQHLAGPVADRRPGRWSAVHDVVDEVRRLVRRRATGSRWPPWSAPGAARPGSRARRWWCRRTARPVGSVSGGCVEGAVYELAQEVMAGGEAGRCSATASATTTRSRSG